MYRTCFFYIIFKMFLKASIAGQREYFKDFILSDIHSACACFPYILKEKRWKGSSCNSTKL